MDIQALVPASALRILDVGCSNGALGLALKARVPDRFVCGIERNPALCAEALGRLDQVYQSDVTVFNWRLFASSESFDCIIFADVLEHLMEPSLVLRESLAVLKHDGHVIVSVPNIRHVTALWSIFIAGTFPRRERGLFDETHLRWFTFKDARQLLEHAGLKITETRSSLRLLDKPGGRLNGFVDSCQWLKRVRVVNEFVSYQFFIKAQKP